MARRSTRCAVASYTSKAPEALSVLDGDVAFGYWHIIPAVHHRQRIKRHQLLGHVAAPWLHVHFAERRAGSYRDPLRPGALTPWRETTKPRVTKILFSRNGRVLTPRAISGSVDVIVEAHQMPPRRVPPPWDGLPVTPARLRWRVRRGERTVRSWHTSVDLAQRLFPPEDFRRIYAPGTRQNRPGKPGLYRFYLARSWTTTVLEDGHYRIEVEASDLSGNEGRLRLPFTITNEL